MSRRLRHRIANSARRFWLRFLDLLEERTLFAFGFVLLTVISLTALAFSYIEQDNQHPIWRSVVYVLSGMDVDPPDTALGQFTATLVLFCGVILVSLLTGYLAAGFSNLLLSSRTISPKPNKRLFENHIIIFGWSAKTKAILRELNESYGYSRAASHDIVIVSNDEFLSKGRENIYKHVWHVRGSQADNSSLRMADVSPHRGKGAKVAAILSDNTISAVEADRKSLLTVLAVEHAHPPIYSIAEVQIDGNTRHFHNANVNEVIQPNLFSSLLLARTLEYPGIASYMDELLALTPTEGHAATRESGSAPISLYVMTASEAGVVGETMHSAVIKHLKARGGIIVGLATSQGLKFIPDIPASEPPLLPESRIALIRRPERRAA